MYIKYITKKVLYFPLRSLHDYRPLPNGREYSSLKKQKHKLKAIFNKRKFHQNRLEATATLCLQKKS